MRHRHVDTEKLHPILSDKPVEIHNPQRKARLIAVAWIVALVMCTTAGAYVASTVAIKQNDDARRQLQVEIDRRTKDRKAQEEAVQKSLDQYRSDQCQITALLPQTPTVADIRRRYQCTNPVMPPASAQSSPAPQGPDAGTTLTALPHVFPPGSAHAPASDSGGKAPAPGPKPTPRPPVPAPPAPAPPVAPPLPVPAPPVCLFGICLPIDPLLEIR